MQSLPPELLDRLRRAIADARSKFDGDLQSQLETSLTEFLVRENRLLRQQVLELWRDLKETADRDDIEYGSVMAAGGGEFTCQHIVNDILKPHVNEEKPDSRVDDIIKDFYAED